MRRANGARLRTLAAMLASVSSWDLQARTTSGARAGPQGSAELSAFLYRTWRVCKAGVVARIAFSTAGHVGTGLQGHVTSRGGGCTRHTLRIDLLRNVYANLGQEWR